MWSYGPNLKSLAQLVLKTFWIVCQKISRSRDLSHALFVRPLGFPKTKLCTKFEVSSSISFEDIVDRMPKIIGVTWPRPRPIWVKLFLRSLGFPKTKLRTKFEVSSWSSFEDMFDHMPKIIGVTWPMPRPFWGKFAYIYSSLPCSSSLTNSYRLRSLTFVLPPL